MPTDYDRWLADVRVALRSINMSLDDWQPVWPFDFAAEHGKGTTANDTAMKANRYWWQQQNKSMGKDCDKLPGCWLPRSHQGECQPIYEPGDYVKAEFEGEGGMPGEWMWIKVDARDDQKRIVYGTLDNEPINEYGRKLKLGSQLAVSYSKVREHKKASDFR